MPRPDEPALPVAHRKESPGHPAAHLRDDAELLAGCRAGSLPAFEELYRQHVRKMKSLAYNMLGNTSDAEDAVQEAFLKIHRGLANFKGQSSFATWCYRILLNSCHDMRRKRQRRQEEPPAETEDGETMEPAARATQHPLRLMLERAVGELSERYRRVFLLFEVEGFSHVEIGEMLGITEASSKNALFEAKKKLRGELANARRAERPNIL